MKKAKSRKECKVRRINCTLIGVFDYKRKGPDRNPGLLKIQYPMKNRYTNGVRAS